MNRKKLPLLLMLTAGAITSLTVYFKGLGLTVMLIALLASLTAFGLLGVIICNILDSMEKKNAREEISDEGEVIEKEPDIQASGQTESEEEI